MRRLDHQQKLHFNSRPLRSAIKSQSLQSPSWFELARQARHSDQCGQSKAKVRHPLFRGINFNVALLQLETPIRKFNDKINSVALPPINYKLVTGSLAVVSAWMNEEEIKATTLMITSYYLLSDKECRKYYGRDLSAVFCAGYIIEKMREYQACHGTSQFLHFLLSIH